MTKNFSGRVIEKSKLADHGAALLRCFQCGRL
jgi:hypothetical protein